MSQISKLDVVDALPEYYLPYAQYVNQTRALPDARDCLKTGTRFIIFAQYLNKLTYDKKARKAVATVSAGMEFSVHGDSSILGTAVRLSQPFSLRYPLIEVKGNNGSQLYGSSVHSAARYLEMRSNKLASEMTHLLAKDTIDNWEWNYTQEKEYPVVLPSLFPNFVNGNTGIGVGMACSIPQFNLRDVCASAIKYLDNPNISFEEIYCPIDFCTGGTIINEKDVKESLKNGKGAAAIIRGKVEYDNANREIIITELPYQVTSSQIVEQVQSCLESGKLPGIEAVFDGSDIDGVKICIKLLKTVSPEKIIKALYKETALQSHYGINMMMLKDGKIPLIYTFTDILDSYLTHMQMVMRKSYEYDLKEANKRLEILSGYVKALDNLDEVLSIIRGASSKEQACVGLIEKLDFTKNQAKAVLTLKLERLVNLEIVKIKKEYEELLEQVKYLEFLLSDSNEFRKKVKEEINRISREYGDERRTTNMTLATSADSTEVIEEKNLIIYFTNHGNLYADETTTLIAQRKGGRGSKIKLEKNEAIIKTISGKNTSSLLVFSNKGKVYSIQFDDLLNSTNVNALLQLDSDEEIIEVSMSDKTDYIICITKNGMIKKSCVDAYNIKQKGLIALKLTDGDSLIKVLFVNDEKIAMLTSRGIFKMIDTLSINAIGRVAQGVIGIKLDNDDYLVDAQIVEKDSTEIISVTKEGLSIRVPLSDFNVIGRATKGKQLQKGNTIGFVLINPKDKEIAISSSQNIIKIPVSSITLVNRGAIGAKAISLKDNIITGVIKEL